jgi:trans-2-enoyl-CoA reductase
LNLSINDELSAELITGKDLNLEQARLYALTNDTEGLSRELAKNFGTAAEFGKMNRIQQEAIAAAVGMQRDELATTLTDQEALKGLSGEGLADAQAALDYARASGMTEKQIAGKSIDDLMKQQTVQERFNQSVEKLKEVFISIAEPVLQIISPFVDLVTSILPAINIAFIPIAAVLGGIATTITYIVGSVSALIGFFTGANKQLRECK